MSCGSAEPRRSATGNASNPEVTASLRFVNQWPERTVIADIWTPRLIMSRFHRPVPVQPPLQELIYLGAALKTLQGGEPEHVDGIEDQRLSRLKPQTPVSRLDLGRGNRPGPYSRVFRSP